MIFPISVKLEMFSNAPIAEVSECNVCLFVVLLQKLLKGLSRVVDFHSHTLRKEGSAVHEFFGGNAAIVVDLDDIEPVPQIVVLSQIHQQISELSLRNVVISMRVLRFQFLLGGLEGTHDHWLTFK